MMGRNKTLQRKIHAPSLHQGFFIDKRGLMSLYDPLRILKCPVLYELKID